MARVNGKVIFVEDALPGEIVDIRVIRQKRDHAFAIPVKFHLTLPDRIEPFCGHFSACGGCTWQNIPYEKQLQFKAHFVEEAFTRIGKLAYPAPLPIIGCDITQYYRNKLEFTFSDKKWLSKKEIDSPEHFDNANALGFHAPGHYDKVIDIERCYLQADPSNEIRLAIKRFAVENGMPFFNIREQTGLLRNLIIRTSTLGEILVLLSFFSDDKDAIQRLMEHMAGKYPFINSLNYLVNNTRNDSLADHEIINYSGKPYIEEQLGSLRFKIGAKSFFQTNSRQAKILYDSILNLADFKGDEVVYDLYTGIGSIALYISRFCKKVIGIEQLEEAIADARENAKLNRIENCVFYAGDVKDLLNEDFEKAHTKPDVLIVDPPRSGLHPKVVKTMAQSNIDKIIYVSCNPTTQARDLSILVENYEIKKIQPVDMFPQTFHIENVTLLQARHD